MGEIKDQEEEFEVCGVCLGQADDEEGKYKEINICMKEMEMGMAALSIELLKVTKAKRAAIRARKKTVALDKIFKRFRKLTCAAGLK